MNRKRKRLPNNPKPKRTSEGSPLDEVLTFLDRFGHRHSERVLTTWPAPVLKAMGIYPIKSKEGGERA